MSKLIQYSEIIQRFFTPSKIFSAIMIAFIIGIFLSSKIDFERTIFIILITQVILFLIIAILWKNYYLVKMSAVILLFIILGIIYFGAFNIVNTPKNIPYNKNLTFKGYIIDSPDVGSNRTKITLKIEEIIENEDSGDNSILNQKILVTVPNFPEYKFGDELVLKGIIEKPQKFEDFDYEKYLARYQTYMIIKQPTNVEYIKSNCGNKLLLTLNKIKNYFEGIINKLLPEPLSSLLDGLLLGSRQNIPEYLVNALNIVGLTHIIAISGYNITIIVNSFQKITLHWNRRLAFLVGIGGILLFTILTGASPSVVRASIIASLFLFARQIGRQGNISIALIFVGLIMILFNPMILKYDVGFQLSFLAVLGLIYISPYFEKIFRKINEIIREPLAATLGAQITVIPIILFDFGRLSIISPFANILVLPIIPVTMFFGFMSAIFGTIFIHAGKIISFVPAIFLKYIVSISEYLSKIPYASIEINFKNWYFVLIYYVILCIVLFKVKKIYKKAV